MINDLSRYTIRRLLILAATVAIGLPISVSIYSSSYAIATYTNPNATATIDNPEVLQDVLPQSAVTIVTQKVQAEAALDNNTKAIPYHVKGSVTEINSSYHFTLVPADGSANLSTTVTINDDFGLLSVTTFFGTPSTQSTESTQPE